MMYRHYKNGKKYLVVSNDIMIQENNVWVPAVLYIAIDDATTCSFVRSAEEFHQKFKEVTYD